MNIINFGQKPCEKVRGYLDSYVSNELLIETNHEVLKHLESCPDCSHELETRVRLKDLLQRAVRHEAAPPDLQEKIRKKIRSRLFHIDPFASSSTWLLAASLFLLVAGWGSYRLWNLTTAPSTSEAASALLSIGVGDHVNCAINHRVSGRHYTLEQMAREMGPSYSGLVPVVSEKVSSDYEVVVAHQCRVNQRGFVHVILRKDDSIASLIITKKLGETYPRGDTAAPIHASGIPLHQARLQNYEVTGFETKDHLVFVASNLSQDKNTRIAMTLAPSVRDYLSKLEI